LTSLASLLVRPAAFADSKFLSPVGFIAPAQSALTAFASGKSFRQFPKCLKSQTAQVSPSVAAKEFIFFISHGKLLILGGIKN